MAEHRLKPDQIIVYRDGVGDSMLEVVVRFFLLKEFHCLFYLLILNSLKLK